VARPHARPPPRHVACRCPYDARAASTVAEDEGSARPSPDRIETPCTSTHDRIALRLALRTAAPSTMYSTVPSVAARDRVRPVCVVSRLWPGPRPPRPARLQRTGPSQPYACYQSYEKDVPTHTVYRQDLTVTPFAQASSDKPERTRTRIPRRASPHPTIEHTSVNHTPKEKGMEGNEGRSRAYSA
jgi:hypothetical protein